MPREPEASADGTPSNEPEGRASLCPPSPWNLWHPRLQSEEMLECRPKASCDPLGSLRLKVLVDSTDVLWLVFEVMARRREGSYDRFLNIVPVFCSGQCLFLTVVAPP